MTKRQYPQSLHQQGSILVTVMVTTMVIMLLVSALIDHYAVSEARAVDESLARIRIYWAMMGHWNYVASRVLAQGVVSSTPGANYYQYFNEFRIDPDNKATISDDPNYHGFYCKFTDTSVTDCGTSTDFANTNAPTVLSILRDELNIDDTTCNSIPQTITKKEYAHIWHYDDISSAYCFVITNSFFPTTATVMALSLRLTGKGTAPALQNLPTTLLPLYAETRLSSATSVKLDRLYRPVVSWSKE
ncbi:hypothetical protein CCP3SC15_490002 [Gammaproteobacteria bacterium]